MDGRRERGRRCTRERGALPVGRHGRRVPPRRMGSRRRSLRARRDWTRRGGLTNTNATLLAAGLTDVGFEVVEVACVDDHEGRIARAIARLAATTRVLVCTGGLGPTTDDVTTRAVASALGVKLVRDETSL